MSYEEAVAAAKKINPNVNTCVEYQHGYMFADSRASKSIGGAGAPFVVIKDSGKVVTMAYFNGKYEEDEAIKESKV